MTVLGFVVVVVVTGLAEVVAVPLPTTPVPDRVTVVGLAVLVFVLAWFALLVVVTFAWFALFVVVVFVVVTLAWGSTGAMV